MSTRPGIYGLKDLKISVMATVPPVEAPTAITLSVVSLSPFSGWEKSSEETESSGFFKEATRAAAAPRTLAIISDLSLFIPSRNPIDGLAIKSTAPRESALRAISLLVLVQELIITTGL